MSKSGSDVFLLFQCSGTCPLQHKGIFLYQIKPCFKPNYANKIFTQAEIRAISEDLLRLSSTCFSFADSLQGGADFVDHILKLDCMLLC